ncbi:MAG: stretch-activated cation channel mid1 [Trizodia sp. TS-e1964]|nr:MAG: stretch-activated cation channel mid1 [Trizodia sp. TS-e1964]
MPFPHLSAQQSRLAAFLTAAGLFTISLVALGSPRLAYAADIHSIASEDHNHPFLLDKASGSAGGWGVGAGQREAWAASADGSILARQNAPSYLELVNNAPTLNNINLGQTVLHRVYEYVRRPAPTPSAAPRMARRKGENGAEAGANPDDSDDREKDKEVGDPFIGPVEHDLKRRQTSARILYLSLNTCLQPLSNNNTTPPQLQIYISTSNPQPGPNADAGSQSVVTANAGYTSYSISAEKDVYVAVFAPPSPTLSGAYSYELAVSTDSTYHRLLDDGQPNIALDDSDANSALFITSFGPGNNFTQGNNGTQGTILLAYAQNNPTLSGLENSICALKQLPDVLGYTFAKQSNNIDIGYTGRGQNASDIKKEFYLKGLNASSFYTARLANISAEPHTIGGGGTLWSPLNFSTKKERNCQIIYGLDFCDQTAWAVPSNSSIDAAELKRFYDGVAATYYQNFNNSLDQIACETESTARYSLARNCTDCAQAYKRWLCSLAIPRCTDFSSDLAFLAERDVNTSRLGIINSYVQPGQYKELLPCEELCYEMVQNCPTALGFACPSEKQLGMSYGRWNGTVRACNAVSDFTPKGAAVPLGKRASRGLVASAVVGVSVLMAL